MRFGDRYDTALLACPQKGEGHDMAVVRLLGPVDVVDSTGEVHAPGSPVRATLLAVLGLDGGRVVEAERLLDVAWDGEPPASGLRALRFHISKLRADLGIDELIVTVGSGYRLDATSDIDNAEAARAVGNFGNRRCRRAGSLAWGSAERHPTVRGPRT